MEISSGCIYPQNQMMKDISLVNKMTTCIIAGLVTGFCFFRIGKRFLTDWLTFRMVLIVAVIILLTAVIYGIYWSFQRRQSYSRSSAILAFWQAVIRYGIAMDLTMIGLQKIFGLQFSTPLGALDLPLSSFSPEDLTWAYFGQSRTMIDMIGSFQILGSFLLLFSRTKLAGVFVLLPVVLNIVLLNFCYHFEAGESIQAGELLIALLYLLFSEYHRLAEFFFRARTSLPSIRLRSLPVKNLIRCSSLVIPLLLIWHYGPPDKNPLLTGRYKVSHLRINQQDRAINSCSDSLLSLVYLDQGNECVFEYNSQQRRLFGIYQLNKANGNMTVVWHYPRNIRDTLFATLSMGGYDHRLTITGKMGRDSVQMELVKAPVVVAARE